MNVLLALACLVAGSSTVMAQNQVTEAINDFGIEFLKKVSPVEDNAFFSSASISTAFAMLLAGSKGQSEQQLSTALKLSGVSDVHDKFHGLMTILKPRTASDKSYELNMANKLVLSDTYQVLNDFMNIIRDKYLASMDLVDFSSNGARVADDLNLWVSEQTRGMIKKVFNGPLGPMTKMVLINAIYFKGAWTSKFDAKDTTKQTFHGTEKKEVDFMYKRDDIRTFRSSDKDVTMIELPYVGNASMIILMPDQEINSFVESLTSQDLKQLSDKLLTQRPRKSMLYMPKFKLEASYDLKPIMSKLGASDIFDTGSADLSGITGNRGLFVSSALHKAVVEVDEEGTKAAAVTVIVMETTSLRPEVPLFRVDKPFLFIIRDNVSGLSLFTGKVSKLE